MTKTLKAETSILQFDFDEKVHPGVTITDSDEIKMIWDEEDNSAAIGFQITIKESTEEKRTDAIEQTAPRLTNILGSITGIPITCKPPVIKIIRNGQTFTRTSKTVRSHWLSPISIENIDISKLSSLLNSYSRLYMQLGHAHNGHRAFLDKDYPQAIREYFLIFEKTGRAEEFKYRNLRHAVSHNIISSEDAVRDLRGHFSICIQRNNYIDLNDREIRKRLGDVARKLRNDIGHYIQEEFRKELA